jgi:hypothetical protein
VVSPATKEKQKEARAGLEMDPLEAGRAVLRGLLNNDLYILTHPEYEPLLKARSEALLASIPRGHELPRHGPRTPRVSSENSIYENSIYSAERNRKQCAQN